MNNGIKDQTVTMAHGAGGRQTSELIDNIFAAHFANPDLTADDAAVLNPPVGKMAVSTDGFIVSPAFSGLLFTTILFISFPNAQKYFCNLQTFSCNL